MVEVIVRLLPHGMEKGSRLLGYAKISNDGTGSAAVGNYKAEFSKFLGRGVWRHGFVSGMSRKKRGPWDLLYLALKSVVGSRNGEELSDLPLLMDAVNSLPHEQLLTLVQAIKTRIDSDNCKSCGNHPAAPGRDDCSH